MTNSSHREDIFRCFLAQQPSLWAQLRFVLGDPDLADEAVQDLFILIDRIWQRHDPERPIMPWLRGVARKVAMKVRQRHGHRRELVDTELLEQLDLAFEESDGRHGEAEDLQGHLRHCLQTLNGQQRELLALYYGKNVAQASIADRVGRSAKAVEMLLRRLRKILHACIQKRRRGELDHA